MPSFTKTHRLALCVWPCIMRWLTASNPVYLVLQGFPHRFDCPSALQRLQQSQTSCTLVLSASAIWEAQKLSYLLPTCAWLCWTPVKSPVPLELTKLCHLECVKSLSLVTCVSLLWSSQKADLGRTGMEPGFPWGFLIRSQSHSWLALWHWSLFNSHIHSIAWKIWNITHLPSLHYIFCGLY